MGWSSHLRDNYYRCRYSPKIIKHVLVIKLTIRDLTRVYNNGCAQAEAVGVGPTDHNNGNRWCPSAITTIVINIEGRMTPDSQSNCWPLYLALIKMPIFVIIIKLLIIFSLNYRSYQKFWYNSSYKGLYLAKGFTYG